MNDEFSSEAFAVVSGLIRLATDPKGCARRVAELKREQAAAAKAKTELAADRAAHDQRVAAEIASLEQRETALRKRQVDVKIAEGDVSARLKIINDAKPSRYDEREFPGTLVREPA
jgi:hypothetical protein